MAAIIPHLEVPDQASPVEQAYDMCVGTLHGDTLGEDHPSCPTPESVLADAHAGLLGMVFVREAVFASLQSKQFTVQPGNAQQKDTRNVYLVLDSPIGPGPAWNPATNPAVRQYQLLSWTSKMNAPSYSLPAGAPEVGGSCPGATAGQSIVHEAALYKSDGTLRAGKLVNIGLGKPVNTPINMAASICEHCYATGGQYSTGQVQFAQILRFLWTRQAINFVVPAPDGSESSAFVETMVYAINAADYKLDGGTIKAEEVVTDPVTGETKIIERTQKLPPEPTGQRFFRIHDSGDFFEKEYLRQWKMIADRLPDITFWAPSRIWATSWGIDAVNNINHDQRNFIIRPSAYEVNEAGPIELGREYDDDHQPVAAGKGVWKNGWAAATTVLAVSQNLGMTLDREQYASQLENRAPSIREAIAHAKTPARLAKLEKELQHSFPRTTGRDPRYTWDCRAYSTNDQGHTCRKAVAPPGYGDPVTGTGCRACWIAPDEIVNYSLH